MTNPAPATDYWPNVKLGFAAWTIGLTASLLNLLNYHHYTRLGLEIPILIGVFLLLAGAMCGLQKLAAPRLSFVFVAMFATLMIDLNADLSRAMYLGLAAAIGLVAYFQEKAVLKITIAAFLSVLVFQSVGLLTSPAKPETPPNEARIVQDEKSRNPRLRPIIHLVLDAYVGFEGMAVPGSNFGSLRAQQEAFYLEHGFQLYTQTYSRHVKTINSLPYFFSYGHAPLATKPRNLQFTHAPRLDYFTDLDKQGYRISSQTPSFVDLCENQPMTDCRNYNRSNLSSLLKSDLSSADKARVIGFTLLSLSYVTSTVAESIVRFSNDHFGTSARYPYNRQKVLPLTAYQTLDAFTGELKDLKYGEVRVIHLLLPHDPYMFDAHCKIRPERTWLDEQGPGPLAARDQAYANQVRCATSRVGKMIEALDETPAGRDAIVVIQGDHGSRTIDMVPYIGGPKLDLRDLALSYSAFFAIRVPGEPAGEVPGRFALDALLGDFARSGFTAAPHPPEQAAEVYMMDIDWIPKRREKLPDFSH